MARRQNNAGFTLLELVLVLMIIATCAAISAPALKGFTKARRLPNTARELVNAAHWCRVQAISEGVTYRLYLDVDGGRWFMAKDDGTGANYVPVTSDVVPTTYILPDGISMETTVIPRQPDNMRYIAFNSSGRSETGLVRLRSEAVEVDVLSDSPLGSYYIVSGTGNP